MNKPAIKGDLRDDRARIVADIGGVSTDYVKKVSYGLRDSDRILGILVEWVQGKRKLIARQKRKHALIQALMQAGAHHDAERLKEVVEIIEAGFNEMLNDEFGRYENKLNDYLLRLVPLDKKTTRYGRKKN